MVKKARGQPRRIPNAVSWRWISCRVTEEEAEQIAGLAAAAGDLRSHWVRRQVLTAVDRQLRLSGAALEELRAARSGLADGVRVMAQVARQMVEREGVPQDWGSIARRVATDLETLGRAVSDLVNEAQDLTPRRQRWKAPLDRFKRVP